MSSLTLHKRQAIAVMIIAAIVVTGVVVGGFSLVQKLTYVPPTSGSGINSAIATGGQTPRPDQIELPEVTANNYDHVRALAIYREFARFYGCAQPLDLQNLSTSMLVPNINTVAVITYVREQRKYVIAESNPKIKLTIKESVEPANSDSPNPFKLQTATWTYAAGVENFATYGQYVTSAPGNPLGWGMNFTFNPRTNQYALYLTPDSGEQAPTFIITAMNSSLGCGAKPDLTKYGFTLEQVSKYGMLGPEAY